jgi:aminoglycoside phosphotransferase (APT) family kinase protein
MVEGRILWDASLPDSAPDERRAVHATTLHTLADLHNADWRAIGLDGFGAPGNYMLRQIDRWTKQYRASQTARMETMERLIDWLPRTAPEDDRTTIVHGDYKLGNMVMHGTQPRVAAVLDWELATLGNPVADFAYLMMPWVNGPIAAVADLEAHGIPTVDDCVAEYCRLTRRPDGLPNLDWFFAFNFFRLAGILQGIVGRVRDGTANAPDAATMEARVPVLAETAWAFAVKAGA